MKNKTNAEWRRPVKEVNVQIGERCRKAREVAEYTQEQLAKAVGKCTQFISDTKRGICGISINTIMSLCSALSFSVDYLLFGWSEEGSDLYHLRATMLYPLECAHGAQTQKKANQNDLPLVAEGRFELSTPRV